MSLLGDQTIATSVMYHICLAALLGIGPFVCLVSLCLDPPGLFSMLLLLSPSWLSGEGLSSLRLEVAVAVLEMCSLSGFSSVSVNVDLEGSQTFKKGSGRIVLYTAWAVTWDAEL